MQKDEIEERQGGEVGRDRARKRKQTMKLIAIIISLACLRHGALADDQASPTPTPTPAYLHHLARPGSPRRWEQINRRRDLDAESQSLAQKRADATAAKANRRSAMSAQAQAREAARERERAQRELDAAARLQSATAIPHPTSDLMKRMGFSEQEVAAQKAREEEAVANPGTKETEAGKEISHAPTDQNANSEGVQSGKAGSSRPGAAPPAAAQKPASASPAP
jgi:hypothetical protein